MTPRRTVHRLLALGRARKMDAELDAEIAAHLELAERDLVAAGHSPEDARRTARQRFGGVEPIKEAHRDSRSARWLEAWWHDLRAGVLMKLVNSRPRISRKIGLNARKVVFAVASMSPR